MTRGYWPWALLAMGVSSPGIPVHLHTASPSCATSYTVEPPCWKENAPSSLKAWGGYVSRLPVREGWSWTVVR